MNFMQQIRKWFSPVNREQEQRSAMPDPGWWVPFVAACVLWNLLSPKGHARYS
jgi:hypothetical protein